MNPDDPKLSELDFIKYVFMFAMLIAAIGYVASIIFN